MPKKLLKKLSERIDRRCVVCGRGMKVILYHDGTYRGGHYFGTHTLPATKKKKKLITFEYWECPTCYWN